MVDIYTHYCQGPSAVARFLTVYIEEAHARDQWYLPDSPDAATKRNITTHLTIDERRAAATRFIEDTGFPIELVCDSMDGHMTDRYRGWPERLYVIVDGVIVYRGRPGPFGYNLPEVKQWLADKYGLRGEITLKTKESEADL